MANTMQFDLVSPERLLASVQAEAVTIPGAEGDMTAMPGHAPLISTLRPGILKVNGPDGASEFVVTGGFAEVSAESISVLAERAVPVGEMTQDILDEMLAAAASARDSATPEALASLAKQAADLAATGTALGLNAS